MINCPKCGAENMLTSIFCHSCGEKLDLDQLAPEKQIEREAVRERRKKYLAKAVKSIVSLAILGVLALAFIPVSVTEKELTSDEQRQIGRTWQVIKNMGNRSLEISLSEAEAEWIANEIVGGASAAEDKNQDSNGEQGSGEDSNGESSGNTLMGSVKVFVDVRNNSYMRITTKRELLGFVPLCKSTVVHLSVPEDNGGDVVVSPVSAKFGRLPLPGPAKMLVTYWMGDVFKQNAALTSLRGKVRKITTEIDPEEKDRIKVLTGAGG